jgi:hypothetical protein
VWQGLGPNVKKTIRPFSSAANRGLEATERRLAIKVALATGFSFMLLRPHLNAPGTGSAEVVAAILDRKLESRMESRMNQSLPAVMIKNLAFMN